MNIYSYNYIISYPASVAQGQCMTSPHFISVIHWMKFFSFVPIGKQEILIELSILYMYQLY